jgi:hypothetical protein
VSILRIVLMHRLDKINQLGINNSQCYRLLVVEQTLEPRVEIEFIAVVFLLLLVVHHLGVNAFFVG